MSVPEKSIFGLAADIETLAIDLMTEEQAPSQEPYNKTRALSIILNLTIKIKQQAMIVAMHRCGYTPPTEEPKS
tara:strand:- start:786 stop:1007 length:222 start_codon:yes stop_codon:yes gene_type:complete